MPKTPLTPLTAYRSSGEVQPEPLLATKLYVPQARTTLVPRPRLMHLLNNGLSGKLTLVTAPPGFGKTTLISEWLDQSHRPTAWISLDDGDNDPVRFLAYMIAALKMIDAEVGETALELISSPQPVSDETILTTLLNEMTGIQQPSILVLDDYHVIDAERIHQAMAFFVDHLPLQMHLVIISRSEPPLPLARLRVRRQLTEFRASDLRFTAEEAAAFLNEIMGLKLAADDVAALEERTEGWVAGLQLAALSMQGRQDVRGFITAFTGDNRYVLDYLAEEVLHRQPDYIQSFLLQTAILNRLNAPLCDAVTGRGDGQIMLETLNIANLFMVSLDDKRRWYRYHQLFADFLRDRLQQHYPDALPELHRRAANWYEANNLPGEAVQHLLAMGDFERAAELVEQVGRTMLMRAEIATLLNWMNALPEKLARSRPRLCLLHAWSLAASNLENAAENRLKDAERLLGISEDTSSTVLRRSTFKPGSTREMDEMFGEVVALRTTLALRKPGDKGRIIQLSHHALERLPEDSLFLRGTITLMLGSAYWTAGDIVRASQAFSEAVAANEAADNRYMTLFALGNLAEVQTCQGQLHQSYNTYQRLLQKAAQLGGYLPTASSWACMGLGAVYYRWNDLDRAARYFQESIQITEHDDAAARNISGLNYAGFAQVKSAQGDIEGAFDLLEKAEAVARLHNSPHRIAEAAMWRTRLWMNQGNLAAAEHWLSESKVEPSQKYSEHWLFETMTLARVRIAQGQLDDALNLLRELLLVAENMGYIEYTIEGLVATTLVYLAAKDSREALAALTKAISLAEPGEYVRVFTEEPRLRGLIQQVGSIKFMSSYIQKLLNEVNGTIKVPVAPPDYLPQALVEPLSDRELEVLRRIAQGLSNQEIADELVVAVSTVKTHINNIYSKLDVRSRTQAIARGQALNLL